MAKAKQRRKSAKTSAGRAAAKTGAAGRVPAAIDLAGLPPERLQVMAEAGRRVRECERVLAKIDSNLVAEILRGQGTFYEWDHYPQGDVFDRDTHAQYYYHAHPVELRGGEHGHFHTFLRPKGMPAGVKPAKVADYHPPADPDDALSHLVAISMDRAGRPIRLFTTNRWVTGEIWYTAEDVIRMLDRFEIDHAWPSWPTNIWVGAMLVLFRPQIDSLIRMRDETVASWRPRDPDISVFEDRDLEITSLAEISVDAQIRAVERALSAKAA